MRLCAIKIDNSIVTMGMGDLNPWMSLLEIPGGANLTSYKALGEIWDLLSVVCAEGANLLFLKSLGSIVFCSKKILKKGAEL